jgi:transposase
VPSRKANPQLTDFEQGRIIGLREAGLSPKEVAARVGHDISVVQCSWHQWIQEGVLSQSPGSVTARFPRTREDNQFH